MTAQEQQEIVLLVTNGLAPLLQQCVDGMKADIKAQLAAALEQLREASAMTKSLPQAKPRVRHRGEWQINALYRHGDVVNAVGHGYVCIAEHAGIPPDAPRGAEWWQRLP